MHTFVQISLIVLVANGLRVVLGLPPIFYWFRSHSCPMCKGQGFIKE